MSDDSSIETADPTERDDGFDCQSICDEIYVERERQVKSEGWTYAHDDAQVPGDLARAASAYALSAAGPASSAWARYSVWPWSREWWKPKHPRRDLIRAAALIVAEIERLDRSAAALARADAPPPEV